MIQKMQKMQKMQNQQKMQKRPKNIALDDYINFYLISLIIKLRHPMNPGSCFAPDLSGMFG